ncbi:peptidoglycan-binding protein [Clostridium fermenticellae]|uniref:Peptidoglycan-binding protein n=1 Tax=Clostridium fermenticellae TaxID=2068654 RepID=A0A386H0J3_9CLOT|nr:L,D-transpeptidase family protein [Clostridium fermenticellae]AYD39156.1 peptidoglycan-binding protein [Clostridium fermenticellae]
MENDAETEKEKKNKNNKVIVGSIICTLLVIYLGMATYFRTHFYFGTEINCVNVSAKTIKEAAKQMTSQMESYKLSLKEKSGKTEQITSTEINLKLSSNDEFKRLKDKQGSFNWIFGALDSKNSKLKANIIYSNKLLQEKINNLSCLDSKNIIEPKNPSFKYSSTGYVVLNEVNGNKIDKDVLYKNIVNALSTGTTTLNLDSTNCYLKPKYTVKSKKTSEIKNILNKYVSSKIIYTFGDKKEVIDGSKINKWLNVDDNYEVVFDNSILTKYMRKLFSNYETIGKTRNFVTTSGNTISIGGGDYGWDINSSEDIQKLIDDIKNGRTVTREPIYLQTAASHSSDDIGNTYVEIDMVNQHLWFYKKGSLVTQGDVVTGNMSLNTSTPAGVYRLKYKERNATLKGEGYASPVNFWMPFNGGIGIHDASWRSSFGGNIYLTSGSHGCVNAPYYLAQTLYNNIDAGTPVVCYY